MNDALYIILAIVSVALVIWWWIYSLAQMRSGVDRLGTVFKRDDWRPYRNQKKVEFGAIGEPWPYRVYNSWRAFLARHIVLDRDADN